MPIATLERTISDEPRVVSEIQDTTTPVAAWLVAQGFQETQRASGASNSRRFSLENTMVKIERIPNNPDQVFVSIEGFSSRDAVRNLEPEKIDIKMAPARLAVHLLWNDFLKEVKEIEPNSKAS